MSEFSKAFPISAEVLNTLELLHNDRQHKADLAWNCSTKTLATLEARKLMKSYSTYDYDYWEITSKGIELLKKKTLYGITNITEPVRNAA